MRVLTRATFVMLFQCECSYHKSFEGRDFKSLVQYFPFVVDTWRRKHRPTCATTDTLARQWALLAKVRLSHRMNHICQVWLIGPCCFSIPRTTAFIVHVAAPHRTHRASQFVRAACFACRRSRAGRRHVHQPPQAAHGECTFSVLSMSMI